MDELMGLLNAGTLAILTPIVLCLVRLARLWPWLDQRANLLPLASIVIGIVLALLLAVTGRISFPGGGLPGVWILDAVLHGAVAGLSASGLYSAGAKLLVGGGKSEQEKP